jgi:hypothetical protein
MVMRDVAMSGMIRLLMTMRMLHHMRTRDEPTALRVDGDLMHNEQLDSVYERDVIELGFQCMIF